MLSNTESYDYSPAQWARIVAERECIMTGSFCGVKPREKLLLLVLHQQTLPLWAPFVLRDDEALAEAIGESSPLQVRRSLLTLQRRGWISLTEVKVAGGEPLQFLARGPLLLEELTALHEGRF
ncbi:hypothetical protein BXP70_28195 [Hymenobacter crusticola]|uniref:Uncharacterized protein n=2 Tax=Hymenobacter crusticola TaxID=1770526 RepID=A0A2C9ZTR1_9BACT|nr:hypothetical protein BXP70_28195 [Hymenobacter crusticola]